MGKWESCFSVAERCVPQRYASNKDALSACELGSVAGKTEALIKARVDETKLGFRCVKQLAELLDRTKDISSSTESGEDSKKVAEVRSEAEKLVLQISLATSGRLFFLTADRLMGLALIGCRVGDVKSGGKCRASTLLWHNDDVKQNRQSHAFLLYMTRRSDQCYLLGISGLHLHCLPSIAFWT